MSSYWDKRLSRRKALRVAAAAGGGLAAISLIGCGSDDEGGDGDTVPSEGISDSTKGTPGGTFTFGQASSLNAGAVNPITAASTTNTYIGLSYSALLAQAWGNESVGLFDFYKFEPDVAATLPEQSPDQLTYTMKLNPNVKFHNGRALTSADVKYSFDRYNTDNRGTWYSQFQNWFDNIQTPDASTVVIKTKFPYADTLAVLAGNQYGYIMAPEFAETPDADQRMMGTGPFIWSEGPPVIRWKKNPNYHINPYPYFDEIVAVGYTDPTKRVSDFIARQIQMPWLVYADERDQIKRERPDAKFQGWTSWAQNIIMRTDQEPFNDKRVRQALSMSIDRKKLRDGALKGEGREDQWFPLMYKDVFDFQEVKDLGNAAKYWNYNPTEAKALLSAAGTQLPIRKDMFSWPAATIGQFHVDLGTLAFSTWKELGIAEGNVQEQLAAQFTTQTNRGNYDGWYISVTSGFNSGAPAFTNTVKEKWFRGPNGERGPTNSGWVTDPQLSDLSTKQVSQISLDDRKATYKQMAPIIAENMYQIPLSTTTQNYFFDPTIKNSRMPVEQGSRRYMMKWWKG